MGQPDPIPETQTPPKKSSAWGLAQETFDVGIYAALDMCRKVAEAPFLAQVDHAHGS